MEIIKKDKTKHWHEKLMEINVSDTKRFAWEDRRAVRSAISDRIKNDFPEFEFTTKKMELGEMKHLEVRRIK